MTNGDDTLNKELLRGDIGEQKKKNKKQKRDCENYHFFKFPSSTDNFAAKFSPRVVSSPLFIFDGIRGSQKFSRQISNLRRGDGG